VDAQNVFQASVGACPGGKNTSQTIWNSNKILSDLINFVADGKLPLSGDGNYKKYINDLGNVLIKNGNDDKKELDSK